MLKKALFLDSYHYVVNETKRHLSSDNLTDFKKYEKPATGTRNCSWN